MWALGFHAAGWMGFSPLVDEETLGLLAGRSQMCVLDALCFFLRIRCVPQCFFSCCSRRPYYLFLSLLCRIRSSILTTVTIHFIITQDVAHDIHKSTVTNNALHTPYGKLVLQTADGNPFKENIHTSLRSHLGSTDLKGPARQAKVTTMPSEIRPLRRRASGRQSRKGKVPLAATRAAHLLCG